MTQPLIKNPLVCPGDAIFAHTNNAYGYMIRFGQAIRWWKYRTWNHMAIVDSIDEDGQIWVIQMARHGERVRIEDVAPGGKLKCIPAPKEINIEESLKYARLMVGIDYGVLTIVSIALNLLLPGQLNFDIRREMTLICSALVARAWEHGGWICPVDPFSVTPAEMDQILGGGGFELS
jgi:hypothetical protein